MENETDTTPSIDKTAFACPFCGAFSNQTWGEIYVEDCKEDARIPSIPTESMTRSLRNSPKVLHSREGQELIKWHEKMGEGKPFIARLNTLYGVREKIHNLHVSRCTNCEKISVWCHRKLAYPARKISVRPNSDLPPHIITIFEEARSIADLSPKGAAALLRLCIQHLCAHLGEPGKSIDQDIASLVKKGLNPLVQKSLDIVRVIGNESVHPGTIDISDDQETVTTLFELVNIIATQMITTPKKVNSLYQKLPSTKLKGIEQRNQKATKK